MCRGILAPTISCHSFCRLSRADTPDCEINLTRFGIEWSEAKLYAICHFLWGKKEPSSNEEDSFIYLMVVVSVVMAVSVGIVVMSLDVAVSFLTADVAGFQFDGHVTDMVLSQLLTDLRLDGLGVTVRDYV